MRSQTSSCFTESPLSFYIYSIAFSVSVRSVNGDCPAAAPAPRRPFLRLSPAKSATFGRRPARSQKLCRAMSHDELSEAVPAPAAAV